MDLASARVTLDADAVLAAFATVPALRSLPPRRAELASLWIKPGRHCNAAYWLRRGAADPPLLAAAFATGPAQAAAIIASLGPHREPAQACVHCQAGAAAPGVLVQLFPADYRLPTLPACFDRAHIDPLLPAGVSVDAAELAGYRPGMRCQIRYRTARGTLYGKVAVEREPGEAFARHKQLAIAVAATRPRFRVAEPFRYVSELRLTMAWAAAGESLHEALCAHQDVTPVLPRVADALMDFHRLPLDPITRVYGIADEIALVRDWVELVANWHPPLADSLRAVHRTVQRGRPPDLVPRALVHRDFYDKQVLAGPEGIAILDLDTACWGDPEIDLGNFAAQLALRGLQLDAVDRCGAYATRFRDAYALPVAAERVDWYRRSALLRLACAYALRPRWRHLAPALITEASRS